MQAKGGSKPEHRRGEDCGNCGHVLTMAHTQSYRAGKGNSHSGNFTTIKQEGVHEEQNFEKILRIRKKQSKKKNTLDLTPFSDVNAPRAQNRRLSKKERLEEISGGHVKVCRGKWTSCTKLLPSSARKTVCGFQAEARDRSYEFVANSRTEIWSVPFLSLFLTFFFSTLISDPTH